MTFSVRLFTTKDGRVQIIGNKDVRALLAACNFPPRMTLLIRATPEGKITLAKSPELLYGESNIRGSAESAVIPTDLGMQIPRPCTDKSAEITPIRDYYVNIPKKYEASP